jgi:hypothetical protein
VILQRIEVISREQPVGYRIGRTIEARQNALSGRCRKRPVIVSTVNSDPSIGFCGIANARNAGAAAAVPDGGIPDTVTRLAAVTSSVVEFSGLVES